MDTVRVRQVAPPERRKLHRLKRQLTNQVNSSRARIILLSSGRVANREIARLVERTTQWVRIVIHRFNSQGLAGIEWYPYWQRRDTPRNFLTDVVEQIAKIALNAPTTAGAADFPISVQSTRDASLLWQTSEKRTSSDKSSTRGWRQRPAD